MRFNRYPRAILFLGLTALSVIAGAAAYSLTEDFSTSRNPARQVWTYGTLAGDQLSFQKADRAWTTSEGLQYWTSSDYFSGVVRNPTLTLLDALRPVRPGKLALTGNSPAIKFQFPVDGWYVMHASAEAQSSHSDIRLIVNGQVIESTANDAGFVKHFDFRTPRFFRAGDNLTIGSGSGSAQFEISVSVTSTSSIWEVSNGAPIPSSRFRTDNRVPEQAIEGFGFDPLNRPVYFWEESADAAYGPFNGYESGAHWARLNEGIWEVADFSHMPIGPYFWRSDTLHQMTLAPNGDPFVAFSAQWPSNDDRVLFRSNLTVDPAGTRETPLYNMGNQYSLASGVSQIAVAFAPGSNDPQVAMCHASGDSGSSWAGRLTFNSTPIYEAQGWISKVALAVGSDRPHLLYYYIDQNGIFDSDGTGPGVKILETSGVNTLAAAVDATNVLHAAIVARPLGGGPYGLYYLRAELIEEQWQYTFTLISTDNNNTKQACIDFDALGRPLIGIFNAGNEFHEYSLWRPTATGWVNVPVYRKSDRTAFGTSGRDILQNARMAISRTGRPFSMGIDIATSTLQLYSPAESALTNLVPHELANDSASPVIELRGAGFVPGAEVLIGSLRIPTVFVDSSRLQATLPPSVLAAPGPYDVQVSNWGYSESGPLKLHITLPLTLDSVNPQRIPAGSPDSVITLHGTSFRQGAQVFWNDTPLPITTRTRTKITLTVPAARLTTVGTASVFVRNPDGEETPHRTVKITAR